MSLINDMLRDLEKRQPKQSEISGGERTPVVQDRRPIKIVVFVCLALLIVCAVWFGAGIFTNVQKPEVVTLPATVPSTEIPPSKSGVLGELATKAAVASGDLPAEIPTDTVDTAMPPGPEVVPEPQVAVAAAEVIPPLLSELTVTKEVGHTSLNISFSRIPQYRMVEHGSGDAVLVISFNQVRLKENFAFPSSAESLINRLSFVPKKGQLDLLVDLAPEGRIESSQLIAVNPHLYRLVVDFVSVPLPQESAIVSAPATPVPHVVEEKEREKSIAKTSKKIQPVAREKQAFQAGMEQLRTGQLTAAEASFTQALLVKPEFLQARLTLVSLLQQKKQFAKAEKSLQQGLKLFPDSSELRKAYARQLLHEQHQQQAIDILKEIPLPPLSSDLEYHALLAAALQAVGEYRSSSAIYAQLVKLRPQKALWWMGMAVSLEQSGYRGEARTAYRKAMSLPGLRPDLQNYIQERLQAL